MNFHIDFLDRRSSAYCICEGKNGLKMWQKCTTFFLPFIIYCSCADRRMIASRDDSSWPSRAYKKGGKYTKFEKYDKYFYQKRGWTWLAHNGLAVYSRSSFYGFSCACQRWVCVWDFGLLVEVKVLRPSIPLWKTIFWCARCLTIWYCFVVLLNTIASFAHSLATIFTQSRWQEYTGYKERCTESWCFFFSLYSFSSHLSRLWFWCGVTYFCDFEFGLSFLLL